MSNAQISTSDFSNTTRTHYPKSDRLNALLAFVGSCIAVANVTVLCACRTFDYEHDTRLSTLGAETIELTLPPFEEVEQQLAMRGIQGPRDWQPPFRELLRNPQHLTVYLRRLYDFGEDKSFVSYHSLLDDLWKRVVVTSEEAALVDNLTRFLMDNETVWAPVVRFEAQVHAIARLEAKEFLQRQQSMVGFTHQTILEHAKARLFTKSDTPFREYVLAKQDAVFVRPTVWAVLHYLREVHVTKYRAEIDGLLSAQLRLHLRYLLIDFLGALVSPDEFEVEFLTRIVSRHEDRIRVLLAIQGKPAWFHAFRRPQFPEIMRLPADAQWPMISIIEAAWGFARDEALHLITEHWLFDQTKDNLTWRAMRSLQSWDEQTVAIVRTLIRRAPAADRLWWAELIVSQISSNQPTLAPQVFVETVSRPAIRTKEEATTHGRASPLESSDGWHNLPKVADAAPMAFLRAGWDWLVSTCETWHSRAESSVLYRYVGSCLALDDPPGSNTAPVLTAFCNAIDSVSGTDPEGFVSATRHSWTSQNATVHRLLIRGLAQVSASQPLVGLEYVAGDRRRLEVGSADSEFQSDSKGLIGVLANHLAPPDRLRLEAAITDWSQFRDGVELDEEKLNWDREARLRLIASIPDELRSPQFAAFAENEKLALPGWREEPSVRRTGGGFVRQISPISKNEIDNSSDENVVSTIRDSATASGRAIWREVDGGVEQAGGPNAGGRVIGELANENPSRAVRLVGLLIDAGVDEAAEAALHYFAESKLGAEDVFRLVRAIEGRSLSEGIRSTLGYLLYRRCKAPSGLPDDICATLERWLLMPWPSRIEPERFVQPAGSGRADSIRSVLWSYEGGIIDSDRDFWPLLGLTNAYLMRSPPASREWLDALERLLLHDVGERTWGPYLSEMRWIRVKGAPRPRGAQVISKIFERLPQLKRTTHAARLIAQTSDLMTGSFVEDFLDWLRGSQDAVDRQSYAEVLTLVAFRDKNHVWALPRLKRELEAIGRNEVDGDAIAVGIALTAARLWDEPEARSEVARVLSELVSAATPRVSRAIATVFWARDDFVAGTPTATLLTALAEHPEFFSAVDPFDLVEHLVGLLPNMRPLVFRVSQAIVKAHTEGSVLSEVGPPLVNVAMTLQRYTDTRSDGLTLLEELLRLGLDDAFQVLRDVDFPSGDERRPSARRQRHRRGPE